MIKGSVRCGYRSLCVLVCIFLIFSGGFNLSVTAQQFARGGSTLSLEEEGWINEQLTSMTLDEKIGQLFMVPAYSNRGAEHERAVKYMIRKYHVGGLIFMQGEPEAQAKLINEYQELSRRPLWMGMDAEWGLNMRLKKTLGFPRNMTLGAIENDSLLYELGEEMGRQLRLAGIHINFAPVVDINNNPLNPVINTRSYGENKFNVTRKGYMFSRGLEAQGIIPCLKHFPGHGDTDTDSHYALPLINHSRVRLDTLELFPFVQMIRAGAPAVMVAHLQIPALDPTPDLPSSLSPKIIQGLLRNRMEYEGLIFSDALNMHGVTQNRRPGEAALHALLAGNDVLLFPENLSQSFLRIKEALSTGQLTEADIDEHVRRILGGKFKLGLQEKPPVLRPGLTARLNVRRAQILRRRLYEAAITLPRNEDSLLPLGQLENRTIAYVQIGGPSENRFDETLKKYAKIRRFYLRKNFSSGERLRLLSRVQGYNTLIISVFGMNQNARKRFGIHSETVRLCEDLATASPNTKTIISVFGSPYSLKFFPHQDAVVMAYEQTPEAAAAAAMAIFGGIPISGRLPVTASQEFPRGAGHRLTHATRMGFAYPEEVGMDPAVLAKVDSMALHYINRKAMPGCAILVMRGNRVVWDKGYGKTWSGGQWVDPYTHIYDLASITKVAATTLSIMRLWEQGKIHLDRPISTYIPELKSTNKSRITIRQLLLHNAGLPGWMPFYKQTFADADQRTLDPKFYRSRPTGPYVQPIAPDLYVPASMQDSVWKWLKESNVRTRRYARYSDIGFILLGKIVENVTKEPLDQYAARNFYYPLGMDRATFNPAEVNWTDNCPPTEFDQYWRNRVIRGYVHDPSASLMGGVAGHAGLFSNIYDLGKLSLMLKEGGAYGNHFFFKPTTIERFSAKQLPNYRRGLGFDKREFRRGKTNPASEYASALAFGHTGFTGTSMWVDPQYDLVYIFLSNRTYPTASNRLLLRENVRTRIMDKLYEAIVSFEPNDDLRPSYPILVNPGD